MCMCICAQMEGGVCVCGGGGRGETYSVFTWVGLIPVEGVYIYCWGVVKSCLSMLLTSYASTRKGWVDC